MLKLLLLMMVARTYGWILVFHRHTSYETAALRFEGFRTLLEHAFSEEDRWSPEIPKQAITPPALFNGFEDCASGTFYSSKTHIIHDIRGVSSSLNHKYHFEQMSPDHHELPQTPQGIFDIAPLQVFSAVILACDSNVSTHCRRLIGFYR